jgi:ketosteroid isomerase-like protein
MMSVEDHLALRNLIARLAEATDIGSMDDYMSCIAPDAVMTINDGMIIRTGSTEIREAMAANRSAGLFGPGSDTMHFLSPSRIETQGDTATASTAFQFFRDVSGTRQLVALGRYHETFLRSEGGWLLVRRETQAG